MGCQYMPFRNAKRAISQRKTGCFAMQNSPFRNSLSHKPMRPTAQMMKKDYRIVFATARPKGYRAMAL